MRGVNPFVWEYDFPPAYAQTSLCFLKKCPGFDEAKFGDKRAAEEVVNRCIDYEKTNEIRHKYPDAVLLPVITNNRLPETLAEKIGLPANSGVCLYKSGHRKSLSAMERLLHRPMFCGSITKGARYIIVDDIITQGGTVSAMRKYVIMNGGTVAAAVTLSCSAGSKILPPNHDEVSCLNDRFESGAITDTLRQYNIAYDLQELTRSQIKYLLRFKQMEGIINKIENTRTNINPACETPGTITPAYPEKQGKSLFTPPQDSLS